MLAAWQAFLAGFPSYLANWGAAIALLCISFGLYVAISPAREITQIRAGNVAAGIVLAAAALGLALPIAAALTSSLSLLDLVIWGAAALLIQLLVLRAVDLFLPELTKRIEGGETASALALAGIKIAAGLITAAGLGDPVL